MGQTIVEVTVEEMGLYGPDEAPTFSHPALPFIQVGTLELALAGGGLLHIKIFQDNDQFALWAEYVESGQRIGSREQSTLYRIRQVDGFPLGEIEAVEGRRDERGDYQEIRITVGGKPVIVKAGEVYEDHDGTLKVLERDESVLIFLDPAAYDGFQFNVPVGRI